MLKILEANDMSVIMPLLHTVAEDGKEAVPRLRTGDEARGCVSLVPASCWLKSVPKRRMPYRN